MAEFVVPLKKEIEDSLTMQGLQNIMGLHRKRLAQFKLLSRWPWSSPVVLDQIPFFYSLLDILFGHHAVMSHDIQSDIN